MFFNYSALNNTVYVVIVGNEANPSVNLSVSFYQPPPPVVPGIVDNKTDDPEIIYQNVTQYVNRTVSVFSQASHPLVSTIIIIICIIFGSVFVISTECLRQIKEERKNKDFDIIDNF